MTSWSSFPYNFCVWFNRIKVDLLSYGSNPNYKWEQYDWMAVINWDGLSFKKLPLKKNCVLHAWRQRCLRHRFYACFLSRRVQFTTSRPIFIPAIQSYCSCLSVGMLSHDIRSTLIRLDRWKKYGRDVTGILPQSFPSIDLPNCEMWLHSPSKNDYDCQLVPSLRGP